MVYPQPLSKSLPLEPTPSADAPAAEDEISPIDLQVPLREFSSFLLGLATVPVLAGICAARACAEQLPELGDMGEEVFRGDRLPVLRFPKSEAGDGSESEEKN